MDLIRILSILILISAGQVVHALPSLLVNNNQVVTDEMVPTPLTLSSGWWSYVDVKHEDLVERTEKMKNAIRFSLDTISPTKMAELKGLFKNISQTLDAIAAVNTNKELVNESVVSSPASYTISEFQSLFDHYHQAKTRRRQLISLQEEEEKIAKQIDHKASDVFLEYRAIKEKNQEKLALGLVLMANRLSWYLWKIKTSVKQNEIIQAINTQENILKRLEDAVYLLDVNEKAYSHLTASIKEQEKELENLEGKVAIAQYRFTGEIGLDFMSRLQEELYAQQIIMALVDAQQVNVRLSILRAIKSIILLNNPVLVAQVDDYNHVDNLHAINELRKNINEIIGVWREQTEKERDLIQGLLSSGSISADNQAARAIIEETVSTTQLTLQSINQLENLTFNLDFLVAALEKQLGESKGWWFKLKTSGRNMFDQTFVKSWNLLFVRLFDIGDIPVTTWDIIQALLVLIIAYYLAGTFRKLLLRLNTNADGKVPPAMYTLSRLVFYLMIVFGIFAAFSSIGVQFTNIAIVAGALSVGIGFGLQSIVNNFVSGIIILFEQNIKVGDFVELDTGLKGTVRDINVRSTIVNTLDNLDIIVPNSELVAAKVTNYTLNEPIVRIHVPFGVAYGTDKELVKKAVLEAARQVEITYDDGANRRTNVWLVGFGDSSLDFELVVWLNPKSGKTTPGSWKSLFNWEIETALAKYGIQIPFPQRDLHVKSGLASNNADKKELL